MEEYFNLLVVLMVGWLLDAIFGNRVRFGIRRIASNLERCLFGPGYFSTGARNSRPWAPPRQPFYRANPRRMPIFRGDRGTFRNGPVPYPRQRPYVPRYTAIVPPTPRVAWIDKAQAVPLDRIVQDSGMAGNGSNFCPPERGFPRYEPTSLSSGSPRASPAPRNDTVNQFDPAGAPQSTNQDGGNENWTYERTYRDQPASSRSAIQTNGTEIEREDRPNHISANFAIPPPVSPLASQTTDSEDSPPKGPATGGAPKSPPDDADYK